LHHFHSIDKLDAHDVNRRALNDCAIRLPSEEDKWLNFKNQSNKERLSFVVYADLECVLRKTKPDTEHTPCTYQHHEVFNIGYYVRCSYDDALSKYRSHRDPDCISWFVKELEELAYRVKTLLSINVPMGALSREQWEAHHNATHCHICEKPFTPDGTRIRDY